MTFTRSQAMSRIEGQRRAIREHIGKFENYPHQQDKEFALRTIRICQKEIEDIKRKCNVYIESSHEDSWTAPYYALNSNSLLSVRKDLVDIIEQDKVLNVKTLIKVKRKLK